MRTVAPPSSQVGLVPRAANMVLKLSTVNGSLWVVVLPKWCFSDNIGNLQTCHMSGKCHSLVSDAREVDVDRFWVNMWGLESDVVHKGLLGRFDIKPMNTTECDVWVLGGCVALMSGVINGKSQIYLEFKVQSVYSILSRPLGVVAWMWLRHIQFLCFSQQIMRRLKDVDDEIQHEVLTLRELERCYQWLCTGGHCSPLILSVSSRCQ